MVLDIFHVRKLKKLVNDLNEEKEKLKKELKESKLENKALKKILKDNENEVAEILTVDENLFYTHRFKTMFLNQDSKDIGEHVRLILFNKLIKEERKHLNGLVECLDFIINKRNKKTSIEKQLRKYLFTDCGNEKINELINTIGDKNNE